MALCLAACSGCSAGLAASAATRGGWTRQEPCRSAPHNPVTGGGRAFRLRFPAPIGAVVPPPGEFGPLGSLGCHAAAGRKRAFAAGVLVRWHLIAKGGPLDQPATGQGARAPRSSRVNGNGGAEVCRLLRSGSDRPAGLTSTSPVPSEPNTVSRRPAARWSARRERGLRRVACAGVSGRAIVALRFAARIGTGSLRREPLAGSAALAAARRLKGEGASPQWFRGSGVR